MKYLQLILGILDKALALKLRKKMSEMDMLIKETDNKIKEIEDEIAKNIAKQSATNNTYDLYKLECERVSLNASRTAFDTKLGHDIRYSHRDNSPD